MLSTRNACRSQMAESWAFALKGGQIEVWSTGIATHRMNLNAIKVMSEAGIDISKHTSKNVKMLLEMTHLNSPKKLQRVADRNMSNWIPHCRPSGVNWCR